MNGRERMLETLAFRPVDIVPLMIHPSPAGLFEHGQKLLDLMRECGHDFDDQAKLGLPVVPQEDFDPDGRYHRIHTDAWGTTWEFRLYGVWGYRIKYPLEDLARIATYRTPEVKRLEGSDLIEAQRAAQAQKEHFYLVGGGVSLFETMQNLCPFEEVLIGIAQDSLEINHLADLLVDYYKRVIENALAVGVDAIMVGDDYGTQQSLMISPKAWRRFFKPRYQELLDPVKKAGKRVFFHSCGKVESLLEEYRAVGADAVWPQLNLYNLSDLSRHCRELDMSVFLHPDRGDVMQRSSPEQVREYVLRLVDTFDCLSGGSWLYVEIDPGFPWENVKALFETAMELRGVR